jgi:carbon monoxide dehydrogenase subunit G
MALKILGGIAVVVVLFVVFVATRPAAFHIERSILVNAPPASAFAQVNDFHAWAAWSPYEKLDPQMTKTFDGAPLGVGAMYAWSGNAKAGEGRMTIVDSNPPSRIGIKLEFTKPFAATNRATFTFVPGADGTKVTWSMDGEYAFMAKAAGLFMDMDKLVGTDFEKGLVSLKALAEANRGTAANAAER